MGEVGQKMAQAKVRYTRNRDKCPSLGCGAVSTTGCWARAEGSPQPEVPTGSRGAPLASRTGKEPTREQGTHLFFLCLAHHYSSFGPGLRLYFLKAAPGQGKVFSQTFTL